MTHRGSQGLQTTFWVGQPQESQERGEESWRFSLTGELQGAEREISDANRAGRLTDINLCRKAYKAED